MKASELRLGNYFMSNIVQQVELSHLEFLLNDSIEDKSIFQPIPLTEEWLVKFGFDNIGCIKLKNQTTFQVTMNEIGSVVWNANITQFVQLSECKYVHQLQNLYFALTGEELEIK